MIGETGPYGAALSNTPKQEDESDQSEQGADKLASAPIGLTTQAPPQSLSFTELHFEGEDEAGLREMLETHFAGCDFLMIRNCVPRAPVSISPALFVSDMDSTMIGQECIDELADYAGLKEPIAAITERAMQGEIDFETSLRERVALLAGLEESAIARCLEERIRPNPGARALVQGLKAKGARTVLVTGGFHHFADPLAQQLGFDRVVGNRLEVKGGALTGRLEGPISDASTKARILNEEMAALAPGAISVAIGDGANDIPMIEAASYGFAYCAKPAARKAAAGCIQNADLTSVLTLLEAK